MSILRSRMPPGIWQRKSASTSVTWKKVSAEADEVFEGVYDVPKVQQAHIEPHVCITYWDEDDRLVIRTSTQVPFHVRRMLAPVLGFPSSVSA